MAQYMPTNLIPSTLTETYTIDATQSVPFRCQLNGTSATTKYRIRIMQNNTASTQVYDTNVVTLASPIYPVGYDGQPNELVYYVPANTLKNNMEYKWTVESYWSNTDSLTSYENVFYTRSSATLTIATIPNPVTNKNYTFSATFSQSEGVAVERFGWLLRNKETQEVLVDTITTNNIYSADIKLLYESLFDGITYEIQCSVWGTDGIQTITELQEFNVQYEVFPIAGIVTAMQTDNCGILLQWPGITYNGGKYDPGAGSSFGVSYYYNDIVESYVVNIPTGKSADAKPSITFDEVNTLPMSIPGYASHAISYNLTNVAYDGPFYRCYFNGTTTKYFELYVLNQKSLNLRYVKDGKIVFDRVIFDNITRNEQWYTTQLVPNKTTGGYEVYIKVYGYTDNGLLPTLILYPGAKLYPSAPKNSGIIIDTTYHYDMDIQPSDRITSIELFGPADVNYIYITDGIFTKERIDELREFTYEPDWEANVRFLATFDQSLSAGNIESAGGDLVNWLVYRRPVGSVNFTHIFDVAPSQTYVVDYGAANQIEYEYYVYPAFSEGIALPFPSSPVSASWWDWVLFVADDEMLEGSYVVDEIFLFGLDVSSGVLTNNTGFNILENFTQYAKIQNSNSNYWSGTLSAYLGNDDGTGKYQDTIDQMNRLKALTSDTRAKFLKDRKGNIWMVKLSAPINEQMMDEYVEQAVTITFTWMEVGSMEGRSIVSGPNETLESLLPSNG